MYSEATQPLIQKHSEAHMKRIWNKIEGVGRCVAFWLQHSAANRCSILAAFWWTLHDRNVWYVRTYMIICVKCTPFYFIFQARIDTYFDLVHAILFTFDDRHGTCIYTILLYFCEDTNVNVMRASSIIYTFSKIIFCQRTFNFLYLVRVERGASVILFTSRVSGNYYVHNLYFLSKNQSIWSNSYIRSNMIILLRALII